MKTQTIFTCSYGLLVALGGAIGYAQAGSHASLVMGLTFGLILVVCSYFISKGKKFALQSALILSLILAFFFTYRFLLTMNFMPAGLMVILSLITAGVLAPRGRYSR